MDDFTPFPFKAKLSLKLLIDYWETRIKDGNFHHFTKDVLEYIQASPELSLPFEDISLTEKHRSFIDFLVSAVVAGASDSKDLVAVVSPFTFQPLYVTKAFSEAIDLSQIEKKGRTNMPGGSITLGKAIKGCLMIMEKFYHVNTFSDRPLLFYFSDEKTGLEKVYKAEVNTQFCDIIAKVPIPPIDKQVIKFLMEKTNDLDLWFQYIHPEDFEFHGFIVFRLIDVTEQEMLSGIKYDLLEKNAVVSKATFSRIQHKLRSLFKMPEIRLGIAYFDPNNNLILNSDSTDGWRSVAESPSTTQDCGDYTGSIYERSWIEKRNITVESLQQYPFKSKVEEMLISNGINNILLAPLIDGEETIGMLELGSPNECKLNSFSAHKVENVLPMFTAAIKRVKEEMSTEVRAIIQEECTAIHPTVQWRFFEAGVNLMNKRRIGEKAVMEEIVFKNVIPLYGMSDVRNSSIERNKAIQKDLHQNLDLVRDLFARINEKRQLPLLDEVNYKVEEQLKKLSKGITNGEENNILDFLRGEVHPLIEHFSKDTELSHLVDVYKTKVDPISGIVYKKRKSFEDSLNLINKTIAGYLDEAEESAQKMFPHYFEKYKTDGVEYSLYIGDELVKNRKFDPFYLKNFHLWQLLTMVEIHQRIEELKPRLRTKLEITQLILVHDQPISIRFRSDEKHFDVEGAYDIRYEIVKKRIDKAYIKNTNERLTQPGKIAIVYNQAKVEDEFRRYFQYLKAKGLLRGSIEELDIEELPGANGLRALRFEIANKPLAIDDISNEVLLKDIAEGLRIH
jgi:hypothetical protein